MERPSLEGLPAKAKEDPTPHEMRLSPAGHQQFSGIGDIIFFILLLFLLLLFS